MVVSLVCEKHMLCVEGFEESQAGVWRVCFCPAVRCEAREETDDLLPLAQPHAAGLHQRERH